MSKKERILELIDKIIETKKEIINIRMIKLIGKHAIIFFVLFIAIAILLWYCCPESLFFGVMGTLLAGCIGMILYDIIKTDMLDIYKLNKAKELIEKLGDADPILDKFEEKIIAYAI